MKKNEWHNISARKVLKILESNLSGLSEKEAAKRLKKYGRNELPEKKKFTRLDIVIRQLKSPLVYVLLSAAFISFLLNNILDAGIIIAAVLINTIVGFVQETKAEQSLEKLKQMVKHKSLVVRDGIEKEIYSKYVVLGDIIVLEAGDRVPADGRILKLNGLEIDEASLTGESVPVEKIVEKLDHKSISQSKENMAYMGTSVVKGKGLMVVTSTGVNTEFGKIALLLKDTKEEKTPLQEKLSQFSKHFSILTFLLVIIIFSAGFLKGYDYKEMFITSVAIAVAAIPEGLLVAVTVILAIGMQRILRKGSLVRKLIAAETLGSTTVICTDKTGTITKGKMQVDHIITIGSLFSQKEKTKSQEMDYIYAIKISVICNNAVVENPDDELKKWKIHGDYTEKALLRSGINVGLDLKNIKKDFQRIGEIPFSSEKKFMATLNYLRKEKKYRVYIKGAFEEIINKCGYVFFEGKIKKANDKDIKFLKRKHNELSKKGLRIISVAFKEISNNIDIDFSEEKREKVINNLVFVGLIALKDPIRSEAKDALKLTKNAGIKTVMITGDNRLTAKTIANELGMNVEDKNIIEGEQLDKINAEKFKNIVENIKVYARVSPYHKSRIVDALQSKGEVVAMTGDGVNDAPALKSADIGIALGSGTEVAKETAEIILLDNNFKTIAAAVEEGRVIYENIKKVALYLISDSFSEVIIITGSVLIGIPLPLTAAQILWINLITDGLPDVALTFEPKEKGIMNERPRNRNEQLLSFDVKLLIIVISLASGILSLFVFWYIFNTSGEFEKASTITFSILAIDSLVYVFSLRSLRHSILQKNIFSNRYLTAAVIIAFLFQLIAVYHPFLQDILKTIPLGVNDWILIFAICAIEIIIIEAVKFFLLRFKEKS